MVNWKLIATALMAGGLAIASASCENEGPAEKAGEQVDQAADKVGDTASQAGEKAQEKAGKTADQMQDSGN